MPRLSDEPHGTHRCGKKWHRKRAKSSSGATQAPGASEEPLFLSETFGACSSEWF